MNFIFTTINVKENSSKMTKIIFLLFMSLNLCFSFGDEIIANKDNHEFDFLIFTQHWPVTVCREWKEHDESHTCKFPKQQEWTIHGIWPTKNGTLGPAFCNNSWHFDPELIKPIESQLLDLWIDVENRQTEYSLWVHEWTKHGTCAAVLEPLNSELNYFSRGIQWMPSFDLKNALANYEIVPSDTTLYSLRDIQHAVISTWNVNPQIECRSEHGLQSIFEIRLCFTKDLLLMDCYHNHNNILTNCNLEKDVLYPQSTVRREPPRYAYIQLYYLTSWLKWLTL